MNIIVVVFAVHPLSQAQRLVAVRNFAVLCTRGLLQYKQACCQQASCTRNRATQIH